MYEPGDYFYSSAPSDVSSDITIDIDTTLEHEEEPPGASGHHGHQHGHQHGAAPTLAAVTPPPAPRHHQPQAQARVSLSDRITRKLFRKKRKEMLRGGNLDR